MYSSDLKTLDRSAAIAAACLIQFLLVLIFLALGHSEIALRDPSTVQLINIRPPVPLPQPRTVDLPPRPARGGSAPKNMSKPAAHSAPEAIIRPTVIPIRTPVVAMRSPVPAESASGGTAVGSGGGGNGTGGAGEGNGGGSGNGAVQGPHLATPVLTGDDFPRELLRAWPPAATIFLRLRINAQGIVSECLIDRGTNVPMIDSSLCNTAHERLRFVPAVDRNGRAVAGWFGYAQPAPR